MAVTFMPNSQKILQRIALISVLHKSVIEDFIDLVHLHVGFSLPSTWGSRDSFVSSILGKTFDRNLVTLKKRAIKPLFRGLILPIM